MNISGFTRVQNATTLHDHIKEGIECIIPIYEFVGARGRGDEDGQICKRI
jgi:hypothetical protein